MSYVKKNLIGDESVVYEAKFHWFIWVWPFIWLFSLTLLGFSSGETGIGILGLCIGLFTFIKPLILVKTNEIVLTSKRVIVKSGFISRDTFEMWLNKIEVVQVKQGIFGRIFNFGTVIIRGTGSLNSTPVKCIARPMEYRKETMKLMDAINEKR